MNGFYVTAVVIQFLDKSGAFHYGTLRDLKQKVNAEISELFINMQMFPNCHWRFQAWFIDK